MREAGPAKSITLKMVAEQADCSIALVSTVLNKARGNTVVSDKTRSHILSVARELGYRPNYLSRSLKSRCSKALGVYVQPSSWRGLAHRYEMTIFGGIEAAVTERGYDIVVLNMSSRLAPQICIERLAESRIDGVLLLHTDHRADWIDRLAAASDRVVAVDCCMETPALSRVLFDNAAAVRVAVEHLADFGHRRIGFIGPCTVEGTAESPDRVTPYHDAVRDLGLDGDPRLAFTIETCGQPLDVRGTYCQREGELGMRALAALDRPPTAVVAYNALAGVFAMRTAQELGLDVPGEMSVVGIDDYELVQYFKPRLTRVEHPLQAMGRAGADLLIDLIEERTASPTCRTFAPTLLPGGSSGPLRGRAAPGGGF